MFLILSFNSLKPTPLSSIVDLMWLSSSLSSIVIFLLKLLLFWAQNNNNFSKKITIELSEDDNHIRSTIEDNGVGFNELKDNIKNILNPYFTTKKNGTGLGLSIVNKIINDHNGKIDFIPIKDGAKINITFLKQ